LKLRALREGSGGLEVAQKSVRQLYEELAVARAYQSKVIPGMAQTEAYTRAALTGVLVEQRVETQHPDEEVEAAVAGTDGPPMPALPFRRTLVLPAGGAGAVVPAVSAGTPP
jgi:hypothetical protein